MERTQPQKKKQVPVDEHRIVPHQRAELVCGELIMTPPAHEPHARVHIGLGTLLDTHVAEGYRAGTPMECQLAVVDMLITPLRVGAVLRATERDNAVAEALHRRGNAYIEALRQASRDAGRQSMLMELLERRLGRALSTAESAFVVEQLEQRGETVLMDRVLGERELLLAWLNT